MPTRSGTDLGFRTTAQARAELDELGSWEGDRIEAPDYPAGELAESASSTALLATWRMALDESRALDGEPYLQATARAAEARMSPSTAAEAGITSVAMISNDRGSITVPAVLDSEMIDGVVWLPSRAPGLGIPQHLAASAGDLVTIGRPDEPVMPTEPVEAPPATGSERTVGVDDDTEAGQ